MMTAQPHKVTITTRFQRKRNFLANRFLVELLLHHAISLRRTDGDPNLERFAIN
jgi:hypothetical protein